MNSPSKKGPGISSRYYIIIGITIFAVIVLLLVLFNFPKNKTDPSSPETSQTTTASQTVNGAFSATTNTIAPSSQEAETEDAQLKTAQQMDEKLPDWIDRQLLDIDGAARRGVNLETVRDIAIHYVGNPGTTAQQNRDFFNQPETKVSSHFVIGLDGEIIQCVPLDEKSSATNDRNKDTISIEVCHPDKSGKFTDASYQSLLKLASWLCKEFQLDQSHVIRHYDVTGKECPLYYVEHEDAWNQLKNDIFAQP